MSHSLERAVERPLRIAMLAPPWIPVPPPGYGGIESVVARLCDELVARGHSVTLFAAPGSRSSASVRRMLEQPHPDLIGSALHEADHVAVAYDAIDEATLAGRPFDVLHDHSGFTAVAMAHRLPVPVVHTLHGPFDEHTSAFYARHGHKVRLVAISRYQRDHAPAGVRVADVVPNPIEIGEWPLQERKDDYLLWIGRMDPVKGAHRAIAAARLAGARLLLAGPVQGGQEQYFRRDIEPQLDGKQIVYLGEVGGERRRELFAGARALLMPIRWAEPFGMVLIEALACGTPVLTFPEAAAAEIVIHGENGFHVQDEQEMAAAVPLLGRIDPASCRRSVESRYTTATVVDGYEAVYERAIHASGAAEGARAPSEIRARLAGGTPLDEMDEALLARQPVRPARAPGRLTKDQTSVA